MSHVQEGFTVNVTPGVPPIDCQQTTPQSQSTPAQSTTIAHYSNTYPHPHLSPPISMCPVTQEAKSLKPCDRAVPQPRGQVVDININETSMTAMN